MQRLRGPWSLSTRLTVLVAILAIPVLLIIALSYADQVRERRASELDTATRSARNGASIIDGFLRDLENTTFAMAGVLANSTGPYDQATYGAHLAALGKAYPELRAFCRKPTPTCRATLRNTASARRSGSSARARNTKRQMPGVRDTRSNTLHKREFEHE